jgi:hypothetical protein
VVEGFTPDRVAHCSELEDDYQAVKPLPEQSVLGGRGGGGGGRGGGVDPPERIGCLTLPSTGQHSCYMFSD